MGKKQGAKMTTGGARFGDKGYFIQPTVFADVKDDMTIANEEVYYWMPGKKYYYSLMPRTRILLQLSKVFLVHGRLVLSPSPSQKY